MEANMGDFLIGTGVFLLLAAGIALFLFGFAKRDIFFTIIEPGKAKIVMRNGIYVRTIFNFPGYGMSRYKRSSNYQGIYEIQALIKKRLEEWKKTQGDNEIQGDDLRDMKETIESEVRNEYLEQDSGLFGFRWVGIPPFQSIYHYRLRWSEIWRNVGELSKETEKEKNGVIVADRLLQRSEETSQFYLKETPYGLILSQAEDKDNIAVDVILFVVAAIRNPSKAAFQVANWWTAVSDILVAEIRPMVSQLSWENLKDIDGNLLDFHKDSAKAQNLMARSSNKIETANDKIFDDGGFFDQVRQLVRKMDEDWGVEILSIRIDDVALPKEIASAATKQYVAKQEAHAVVAKAEGDATAISMVAAAEAGRVTAVMGAAKALGDEGVAMKITEDMAKGGKTIFAVGSLLDSVKGILGRNKEES